jgi:hypothetical protein
MEIPMVSSISMKNRVRLAIENLEGRDTPSTLSVNLGDGAYAAAVLSMETGPGASGAIDGHAASQSGVSGTILLGTANQ